MASSVFIFNELCFCVFRIQICWIMICSPTNISDIHFEENRNLSLLRSILVVMSANQIRPIIPTRAQFRYNQFQILMQEKNRNITKSLRDAQVLPAILIWFSIKFNHFIFRFIGFNLQFINIRIYLQRSFVYRPSWENWNAIEKSAERAKAPESQTVKVPWTRAKVKIKIANIQTMLMSK